MRRSPSSAPALPALVHGLLVLSALLLAPPTARADGDTVAGPGEARGRPALPLCFEPNRGQIASACSYLARAPGLTLLLEPGEIILRVAGAEGGTGELRMRVHAARPDAIPRGVDPLPGVVHHYVGNDPARWLRGIPTFGGVLVEEILPGIDLALHGTAGALEYDFRVAPGADPNAIEIEFVGAERIELEGDDLLIHLAGGTIRQHAPTIFEEVDGDRRAVQGRFAIEDGGGLRFELGERDPSVPLVIDPVVTVATYLGGSAAELPDGIAVASSGDVVVMGTTNSLDFPVASAVQGTGGGAGNMDLFLSRLSADGTTLLHSTYFGGSGHDGGNISDFGGDIVLDPAGNAWITSTTYSVDFPVTANAYQASLTTMGLADAVIAQFDPSGALLYSTYLGSTAQDMGHGIEADPNGGIIVVGQTVCSTSSGFPITLGAYKTGPMFHPFTDGVDGFVTKFDATGALVFSTFIGGLMTDRCNGVALDAGGNIIVGGQTDSSTGNFPVVNAIQPTYGGNADGWAAKLDPTGSFVEYLTYIGGSSSDGVGRLSVPANGNCIAVDPSGNATFIGFTNSTDFPTLPGAFQSAKPGTSTSAMLFRLAPDGAAVYSTYLGGSAGTYGYGVAVDPFGRAYATGRYFGASGFPLVDPIASTGGIYLAVLDPTGSALEFSTLFGGGIEGHDVVLDAELDIHILGQSNSGFPTTPGAFQPTGSFACVVIEVSGLEPKFIRGDCSPNGAVDVADAVNLFGLLFLGTGLLLCPDSCDSNDDGLLNIADGIYTLNHLFVGGSPPPPAPWPLCGIDWTPDGLDPCGGSPACP